jgi:hypothetical protein
MKVQRATSLSGPSLQVKIVEKKNTYGRVELKLLKISNFHLQNIQNTRRNLLLFLVSQKAPKLILKNKGNKTFRLSGKS